MLAPLKHLTSALFMSSHFYNTYAMSQPRLYKPADAAKHAGTIMGWPTRQSVFGSGAGWSYPGVDLQETRKEIAGIAKAIAKYEPVQMLVRDPKSVQDPKDPDNLKSAQQLLGSESNVTLVMTDNIDSLWLRDTAPLFVFADNNQMVDNTWPRHADPGIGFKVENTTSNVVGLDLNFNQWGRKLPPSRDSYVAPEVCQRLNKSCLIAPFVGEGGAIEVDGEGTLIATEASLLNPNRNPGIKKAEMEQFFARSFGINKTIWISGAAGYDITDDHIDGLARFASPGTVLLSRPFVSKRQRGEGLLEDYQDAVQILSKTTDAKGRHLKTIPVYEPNPKEVYGDDYDPEAGVAVEYVNFHLVNGGVIMAAFGIRDIDDAAAEVIQAQFPDRKVEQVSTYQLGLQGGGIHCATQQYFL